MSITNLHTTIPIKTILTSLYRETQFFDTLLAQSIHLVKKKKRWLYKGSFWQPNFTRIPRVFQWFFRVLWKNFTSPPTSPAHAENTSPHVGHQPMRGGHETRDLSSCGCRLKPFHRRPWAGHCLVVEKWTDGRTTWKQCREPPCNRWCPGRRMGFSSRSQLGHVLFRQWTRPRIVRSRPCISGTRNRTFRQVLRLWSRDESRHTARAGRLRYDSAVPQLRWPLEVTQNDSLPRTESPSFWPCRKAVCSRVERSRPRTACRTAWRNQNVPGAARWQGRLVFSWWQKSLSQRWRRQRMSCYQIVGFW